MDNLKTWWDFNVWCEIWWQRVGRLFLSQILIDMPVQRLSAAFGGGCYKAQCHGNHIKKHLKTDLLTKAMKIVLMFFFFSFERVFHKNFL